jgi:hypothetical protein
MRTAIVLMLSATLTLTRSAGVCAEMYAYPDKGQSTKQQQRDKRECQEWATQQTGVDPSKTPAARRKLGGAAGGAAVGAARGAAEGEAGEGAARGAVRGRLLGAIRQRREERQQNSGAEGGEPQQGKREDYDRAYGACLTGRGYTVK